MADPPSFIVIPYDDIQFDEVIGRGGFGVVHRGFWKSHHLEVAIKVLLCDHLDDEAKQEFIQEIEVMWLIRGSKHVVTLLGACIEDGHYCLVMEYASRGSLYSVLKQKPQWNWIKRVNIAYYIVKSVNNLHQHQPVVLHRDIKSLNCLVENDEDSLVIKVADFGLSRARHESELHQQYTNSPFRGTISWTAPEQLVIGQNRPKYNEACDIYSLGMVLWELLTGKQPYSGASPVLIPACVMRGDREDIPADVPDCFRDWIKRCWDHDPQRRPACDSLLMEMRAIIDDPPSDVGDVGESLVSQIQSLVAYDPEDAEIQLHACRALFHLSMTESYRPIFIQTGGIKTILDMGRHPISKQTIFVFKLFWTTCICPSFRPTVPERSTSRNCAKDFPVL